MITTENRNNYHGNETMRTGENGIRKAFAQVLWVLAIIGFLTLAGALSIIVSNPYHLGSLARAIWYIEREGLQTKPADTLVEGAIRGVVAALGDPYSTYLSREELKELEINLGDSFGGIGIEVGTDKENRIRVLAPIKNTPAARAGLKSGDIILKINDENTSGMTIEEAVNLIRGEKGTEVRITVFREADNQEHEFRIIRDEINVESVESKLLETEPPVAYIQITRFAENTGSEFREHLEKMIIDRKARGLIIDLRDNPGGRFDAVLEVADIIMSRGNIVKIADYKGKSEVYSAGPGGVNLPIVVLVNGGSASSSEILAGALKDNGLAILVGEKTYGKGLVQTLYDLPGGDAIKLTTDKYYTPKGTDINQIGIVPDYIVANPVHGNRDAQLDKALELLKKKIKQE